MVQPISGVKARLEAHLQQVIAKVDERMLEVAPLTEPLGQRQEGLRQAQTCWQPLSEAQPRCRRHGQAHRYVTNELMYSMWAMGGGTAAAQPLVEQVQQAD